MKRILFLLLILILGTSVYAQKKVNWMDFEEALEAAGKEPKKIFIDVYTDWCGWCKVMDKNTFTDTAIARILNEEYYPVKLDAESKETYKYMNYTFTYKKEYKVNELAAALLQGQMSYPSVVFLDEQTRLLTAVPGAQKPETLKPILLYFDEDHHKTTQYDIFLKQYQESQNKN